MTHTECFDCGKKIPTENDWSDLYLGLSISRGFNGGEWIKYLCGHLFIQNFCSCKEPSDPKNIEDLFCCDEQ